MVTSNVGTKKCVLLLLFLCIAAILGIIMKLSSAPSTFSGLHQYLTIRKLFVSPIKINSRNCTLPFTLKILAINSSTKSLITTPTSTIAPQKSTTPKLTVTKSSLQPIRVSTAHSREADLTPQELFTINRNITGPGAYRDKKYSKNCHNKCPREQIFRTVKWLLKFAAKRNITWFATYGTLIGAWRHQDCLPWEHDMDFGIFQRDEKLIRKIQTPRSKLTSSKGNIVTRPGPFCLFFGSSNKRQTCSGRLVSKSSDVCSFCGPLARIFFSRGTFADLFIYKYVNVKSNLKIYDEGMYDYTGGKKKYTDPAILFPLKKCTFMGLTLLCPRNEQKYIESVYGSSKTPKICKNKKWVKS